MICTTAYVQTECQCDAFFKIFKIIVEPCNKQGPTIKIFLPQSSQFTGFPVERALQLKAE